MEDPKTAFVQGMLDVSTNNGELTVHLAYSVINFDGEAFSVTAADDGGTELGYIILPDGLANSRLIDPIWTNIWSRSRASEGGSGSTGGAEEEETRNDASPSAETAAINKIFFLKKRMDAAGRPSSSLYVIPILIQTCVF